MALVLPLVGPTATMAQLRVGPEFRVNTYTTSTQVTPTVAVDRKGNFVVLWDSEGQDGSGFGVFGQRVGADGGFRGTEFRVNTFTTGSQGATSVSSSARGDFVAAWMSSPPASGDTDVFVRRFNASGAGLGLDFRANTYTTGAQFTPSVASDAAGNFVVVWRNYPPHKGVFGQRFGAAGEPRGSEFQVNTTTSPLHVEPQVASDLGGRFVVIWESYGQDGSLWGVFGRRYSASGAPLGGEFRVNSTVTGNQRYPAVAMDASGGFVVVWETYDGSLQGIWGQRFDAAATPLGGEFRVNTYTRLDQRFATVASDESGNFTVAWESYGQDGHAQGVFAQRFLVSGAPRGGEFQVSAYTTLQQWAAAVASDPVGNLLLVWNSYGRDGSADGVYAQRFGGLLPAALAVDTAAGPAADGNGVLEPGETVDVKPAWRNVADFALAFTSAAESLTGPAGATYVIDDATADYGLAPLGSTVDCGTNCFAVSVSNPPVRPAQHWDAVLTEHVLPDTLGQTKRWALHLGGSFADVPRSNPFYRFVETLLHHSVTGGCGGASYCPASSTTRAQMAVFLLVADQGAGYVPVDCATPLFNDVPASSPFCRWIEELARRGVVSGCGGGGYCPADPVTREQMAVFVLRTLDPLLNPPPCTVPMFADVPASSPFCRWIEELARRGVVTGCGGGNYCPAVPVTREQMGAFISLTFGLTLLGP